MWKHAKEAANYHGKLKVEYLALGSVKSQNFKLYLKQFHANVTEIVILWYDILKNIKTIKDKHF